MPRRDRVASSIAPATLALAASTVLGQLADAPEMPVRWQGQADREATSFGYSLAGSGDVDGDGFADVLVGAPNYWLVSPCCEQPGLVELYRGSPTGLSLTPSWQRFGDFEWASFGTGVAGDDFNGDGFADAAFTAGSDLGSHRVFVHHGSAAGLGGVADWKWTAGAPGGFGPAVASAGDVNGDGFADLLVAGRGDSFVFHGSGSGLSLTPDWTRSELAEVASAGDVHGDGYDDLIARRNDQTLLLFDGSPAGLSPTPGWSVPGWGSRIAGGVDVNGDGYDEVFVGDPGYDNGQADEGRIVVFHGSASGLSSAPDESLESDVAGARFGASLAAAGDANGDGHGDVLVGVPSWPGPYPDRGAFWLFLGSPTGLSSVPYRMASGPTPNFPFVLAPAGDVDADGYDDMLASPFYADVVQAAYAYHGLPLAPGGAAGAVPDGTEGASPLLVSNSPDGGITLAWGESCHGADADYEIYEGALGEFFSHVPRYCGTDRQTIKTFTPAPGASYYLVVPRSADREGSYGRDSDLLERPSAITACLPREIADCP